MNKIIVLLLFFSVGSLAYSTWYVRVDGGRRTQCTGRADAAFDPSNSKVNTSLNTKDCASCTNCTCQDCAFGDYRLLYDTNEYLSYNNLTWVIKGGDTVIIDNTTQWRVGADPAWIENSFSGWCWGGSPYGCGSYTPIPAGTASNPTRFLGRNWENCSIGTGIYQVPDPAKLSYLYGGQGLSCVFSLGGAQHVEVQCLELTSHSNCSWHGSPAMPRGCSNNNPLDEYTSNGLCTDIYTDQVLVRNVWTHGHSNSGIQGAMWNQFNADTLRIGVNGECGWNFDDGHPANNPNTSVPLGEVSGSHIVIEWSGCNQLWTEEGGHEFGYCYDQSSGGYGDGIGTPNIGAMSWNCDYCVGLWNTQDAFDLGHVGSSDAKIVYNNSFCYGNMASTYKAGGVGYFETSNSVSLGNCYRMDSPIPGVANTYNTYLSLFCRASGDHLAFNVRTPGVSDMVLRHNTIVGYAFCVADVQCWASGTTCENTYSFIWENNLVYGLELDPAANGGRIGPGMWNIITPTQQDYNVFEGLHFCPTMNTTDKCTTPNTLNMTFRNQPIFDINDQEALLDDLDITLVEGGIATHAGTYLGPKYSHDLIGNPRDTKSPSVGALEYGSELKFDQSWFISVYGGKLNRTAGDGGTSVEVPSGPTPSGPNPGVSSAAVISTSFFTILLICISWN